MQSSFIIRSRFCASRQHELLVQDRVCQSTSPFLVQLPIHHLPPSRPESPHGPNHNATRRRNDTHPGKQPPVANRVDQRLRNDSAHASEHVPYKIVHRNAVGGLLGHELGEHGQGHGEDEHGADAVEEVGNHGDQPEDALLGRPAVPDECARIQEGADPGVLAHAVFGPVHQFSVFVVAAGTLGFSRHDLVRPFAAEDGSEDVADGVGDVG